MHIIEIHKPNPPFCSITCVVWEGNSSLLSLSVISFDIPGWHCYNGYPCIGHMPGNIQGHISYNCEEFFCRYNGWLPVNMNGLVVDQMRWGPAGCRGRPIPSWLVGDQRLTIVEFGGKPEDYDTWLQQMLEQTSWLYTRCASRHLPME